MTEPNAETAATIPLPAVLNLGVAEDLREKLMQTLVVESDLVLDASEVTNLTTPCLQVLISAGRTVEENGNSFSLMNASEPVKDAFADLGLMDIFNTWSTNND
ncbi:MAG: STAS domain-containing protein [Sneathiellales bacterium]|nr:STAS domain-containing protein [Sneathiellales bacterium]